MELSRMTGVTAVVAVAGEISVINIDKVTPEMIALKQIWPEDGV